MQLWAYVAELRLAYAFPQALLIAWARPIVATIETKAVRTLNSVMSCPASSRHKRRAQYFIR